MRYVVATPARVSARSRWVQPLAWTALAVGIAGAAGRASQRLLWNDELFTLYTSQLASVDIFKALATGLDLHPPAGYFVVKATTLIFGDGLVQARLCALAGFAAGLPGYRPIRGSSRRSAAWNRGDAHSVRHRRVRLRVRGATLRADAGTVGRRARMLAGHEWSKASRGARGPRSHHRHAGLVSLLRHAAGDRNRGRRVHSRALRARRPGVWIALGAGLLPLVAFLPLLQAGAEYGGAFWTRPSPGQLLYTYRLFLFPTLLPAAIVLAVWSLLSLRRRDPQVERPGGR